MEGENQVRISILIYSDDNGKKGEKSGRSKMKDEIKKKWLRFIIIEFVMFYLNKNQKNDWMGIRMKVRRRSK